MITLAPFAALIMTYGTRSPTVGAVAASLCQYKIKSNVILLILIFEK